jgi:tetratricopeptide (TPR) repeat protein
MSRCPTQESGSFYFFLGFRLIFHRQQQGGLRQEAIEMYQKVLQKNPTSVTAMRGIADLYYADWVENAEEALFYYEKLLEIQKTAELYYYAATCKRYLGDPEGARYYYLRELEMDPEDLDAYQGLACIASSMGDYQRSLELLNQALAIMEEYDRPNSLIVEDKAKVLRRLGRHEDALNFAIEAQNRYH